MVCASDLQMNSEMRTGQGEKGFAKGKKSCKNAPEFNDTRRTIEEGEEERKGGRPLFPLGSLLSFRFRVRFGKNPFSRLLASFFCSQAPFQKMHSQFRVGPLLLSHPDRLFRQKSLSFLLALSCKTFTLFANRAEKDLPSSLGPKHFPH